MSFEISVHFLIWFANICSQSVVYLFIIITMSFSISKGMFVILKFDYSIFPLWKTVTQPCISKTLFYIVSKSFFFFFKFYILSLEVNFLYKVKDLAQSSFICCFCLFVCFSLMVVQLLQQHFLQRFFPLLITVSSFLEINWVYFCLPSMLSTLLYWCMNLSSQYHKVLM